MENQQKPYLYEYEAENSVRKYRKSTAGKGIAYLLAKVYGPIYLENVRAILDERSGERPLRILEFGCGGGMNCIHLVKTFKELNIPLEAAYGTDFSESMIVAANKEAESQLAEEDREKVTFAVASNETLQQELSEQCGVDPDHFRDYFDLILGVNTFRYCWRNKKSDETAQLMYDMLAGGGRVIVIDMNNGFPYFLAKVRPLLRKLCGKDRDYPETVGDYLRQMVSGQNDLPTLEEYVNPFRKAGFSILREETFCWIAHSSGSLRLLLMRAMAPLANAIARRRAMRSLVVAKKP